MKRKKEKLLIGLSVTFLIISVTIGLILPMTKEVAKKVVKVNTSPKLTEKHCLESLCTNKMKMSYQTGTGNVTFVIKNEGSETVPAGFLKVISQEDKTISYIVYHKELQSNEETTISVICDRDAITTINDYELASLTEKELAEAEALFNEDIKE